MNVWSHQPTSLRLPFVLRFAGLMALCVVIIATLLLGHAAHAAPGVNQTVSFQGRLLSSTGTIVPDGFYNIQFKIYQDGPGSAPDNPGGTLKWTETYANTAGVGGVDVKNGYFSVNLGSKNAFGTQVDWNQDTLWLSMNIAGSAPNCPTFGSGACVADGEMLPMKRITASPFALNSARLEGKTASDFLQNSLSPQTASFNITGSATVGTLASSGNITTSSGIFQAGSNQGITSTCDTSQVLTGIQVSGGIVTGGTCVASVASGSTVTLQGSTPGTAQTGNVNITGVGIFGAGIQSPTIDTTSSGGSLSIGTTNASSITIGNSNIVTSLAGPLNSTAAISLNGTYSSDVNNYRISIGGTLNSSATNSQYGLQNQVNFNPSGASLNDIYGFVNTATLSGSDLTLGNVYGGYNRILTTAGYTGQITNGYGMYIDAPSLGGGGGADGRKIANYNGLYLNGTSNGGNTANAINNYGIQIQGNTATAGVGGTVRNYGLYMSLSSGGATGNTSNYGLYMTGNGGSASTNWAIYNDSTAANYLQGNVTIGTASNPNNYSLNVAGDLNSSTQYRINGSTALTDSSLAFNNTTAASSITSANGQSLTLDGKTGVTIQNGGTTSASLSASTVQVGNGVADATTTVLSLDQAAAAPTAALGSMYYDTTLGKVQCYEAKGWGSCGSAPDNFVSLSPQYANAVVTNTGTGTISTDFCSSTLHINDGTSAQPTICGTNETYNYYKWTATDPATTQTRSIYVNYQLPTTFNNFAPGSTSLMARTDNANSHVTYQLYRNNNTTGLTACGGSVTAATGTMSSWQESTASGSADPSNCGFSAGDTLVVQINLATKNNANAYVSNLGFVFSNK